MLLYSVSDDYECIAHCVRHTTPCLYIDFSVNGEWIRTNSANGDLYFFNVDDGAVQTNISSMRDVQWASQTCPYSWHTKGLHTAGSTDRVVATLASIRRETTETAGFDPLNPQVMLDDTAYLAAGTELGQLYLYRFPCISEVAETLRFPAHAARLHVLGATFDFKFLLSAGREDGCILVYRLECDKVLGDKAELAAAALESEAKAAVTAGGGGADDSTEGSSLAESKSNVTASKKRTAAKSAKETKEAEEEKGESIPGKSIIFQTQIPCPCD